MFNLVGKEVLYILLCQKGYISIVIIGGHFENCE